MLGGADAVCGAGRGGRRAGRSSRAARAGGTGHLVAACPTAKGTPKWWDVMVTRTASGDGLRAHLLVISRDITQQRNASEEREQLLHQLQAANIESKRVVEQLRASEERYRTLFDSVDEGFCIFEMLFDEGTFVELDELARARGDENKAGSVRWECARTHGHAVRWG